MRKQQGFTIIELLIATTIFSVILLAAAASLIQISRLYYKGVISARTQAAARSITDDISRTIQFTSGKVTPPGLALGSPGQKVLCAGDVRYTFVENMKVNDSLNGTADQENHAIRHALWQDGVSAGSCTNDLDMKSANPYQSTPTQEGREILDRNMRLTKLTLTPLNPQQDQYSLTVGVIYGDDDLLDNPDNPTKCKTAVAGAQWCASSELTTQVYRRVE